MSTAVAMSSAVAFTTIIPTVFVPLLSSIFNLKSHAVRRLEGAKGEASPNVR